MDDLELEAIGIRAQMEALDWGDVELREMALAICNGIIELIRDNPSGDICPE